MRNIQLKAATALLGVAIAGAISPVQAGSGTVTLLQTGDIHGHMLPRPNLRSDAIGKYWEGGLARMYTKIKEFRTASTYADCSGCKAYDHSLLFNTGDTVQGSGEALFSRGQAMVDVLNPFGYTAFAPGNWDFLYGPARFEELFKGTPATATTAAVAPLANWNAMAANLYYTNQFDDTAVCGATATDPATGLVRPLKRVLPIYMTKQVGNVKVGILGMTTARAINAVGTIVTKNYLFTDGKTEVPCFVDKLRKVEKADVVVMISELELGRDVQIAETLAPAPDVIMNSDMHEKTVAPIVATNPDGHKTLLVEEGQDGTVLGKMDLTVLNGVITKWAFKQNVITSDIIPDLATAARIVKARAPFVTGTFVPGQTVSVGGNTTMLMRPVDEVIAYTQVGLHRSNFVTEDMPGVVEGTSHDLIADAMAAIGQAQSSSLRGFRYGTHVSPGGAITMEDIYHYIPIASKLGRTDRACGADLKFAIEQSIGGTFDPNPGNWTGGWMFGYHGVNYDVDACDGFMVSPPTLLTGPTLANPTAPWSTNRGSNIKVNGVAMDDHELYDNRTTSSTYQQCLPSTGAAPHGGYTVTGYWFADDPVTINNCNPCRGRAIQVVKTDGTIVQVAGPGVAAGTPLPNSLDVMDVSEAVVKYLKGNLGGLVTSTNLPIHRLTVKRLPTINPPGYNFKMIQPIKGASPATCPLI